MKFAILAKRTDPIWKDGKNVDINTEKLNNNSNNNGGKKSEEAFIQLWALFHSYFIVRSEFRNIESRESSRRK